MISNGSKILVVVLISGLISCKETPETGPSLCLWYDHPANSLVSDVDDPWQSDPEWLKALPVGNGFLGAMVYGDVNQERIQLNEKTLWSGSPDDNNNPQAADALSEIRNLLFKGAYKQADELTQQTQVCKGVGSSGGTGANAPYGCFQTLGDLRFDFGTDKPFTGYTKELDLRNGLVSVTYMQDGINYKREVFASYPHRVLVLRFSSDRKGAISFKKTNLRLLSGL